QIYDEIEFGRLLDGNIGRPHAAENLVNKIRRPPEHGMVAGAIGHQPPGLRDLTERAYQGKPKAERQGRDPNAMGVHEGLSDNVKGVRAAFDTLERRSDILRALYSGGDDVQPDRGGGDSGFIHFLHGDGVTGIGDDRQPAHAGDDLAQQLNSLADNVAGLDRHSGDIAAGPRQARNEAAANRIDRNREHD